MGEFPLDLSCSEEEIQFFLKKFPLPFLSIKIRAGVLVTHPPHSGDPFTPSHNVQIFVSNHDYMNLTMTPVNLTLPNAWYN